MEIQTDIDQDYITIKIPLLDEPVLASSGKCHIIAKTNVWHKTIHKVNGMTITLPPITIIAK